VSVTLVPCGVDFADFVLGMRRSWLGRLTSTSM
jgi:hypothetical protein